MTYQYPDPIDCSNVPCDMVCEGGFGSSGPTLCKNNACISAHATAVASRIASNHECPSNPNCDARPYHAANVDLFVTISFEGGNLGASGSKLLSAYSWLSDEHQVELVNESYTLGISEAFMYRSVLADWFARYRNVTFVQAAGNTNNFPIPDHGFPNHDLHAVQCDGYNTICVGAYGAGADTPGSFTHLQLSPESRWGNPYVSKEREIERPHLVAEGFSGDYAESGASDPNTWSRTFSGTSLAAPVVTGYPAPRPRWVGQARGPPLHRYRTDESRHVARAAARDVRLLFVPHQR